MKKHWAIIGILVFVIVFSSYGLAEASTPFDEAVFTDAGYSVDGDIFSGQKVIYKPNDKVRMLDYTTKMIELGLKIDTKIFGKTVKEEGELPAWTEGDTSQFHEKQSHTMLYPCIVYNSSHEVPYSFVVALSLPPTGESRWLANQGPYGLMIATDANIYTLNRYRSSSTSFYRDVVFLTMNEDTMEMIYDLSQCGVPVIRATSFDGKTEDIYPRVPVMDGSGEGVDVPGASWSDGLKDTIEAWELYVQAGGTSQDLSPYANMLEVKVR